MGGIHTQTPLPVWHTRCTEEEHVTGRVVRPLTVCGGGAATGRDSRSLQHVPLAVRSTAVRCNCFEYILLYCAVLYKLLSTD